MSTTPPNLHPENSLPDPSSRNQVDRTPIDAACQPVPAHANDDEMPSLRERPQVIPSIHRTKTATGYEILAHVANTVLAEQESGRGVDDPRIRKLQLEATDRREQVVRNEGFQDAVRETKKLGPRKPPRPLTESQILVLEALVAAQGCPRTSDEIGSYLDEKHVNCGTTSVKVKFVPAIRNHLKRRFARQLIQSDQKRGYWIRPEDMKVVIAVLEESRPSASGQVT